jgi:hypothetical protein
MRLMTALLLGAAIVRAVPALAQTAESAGAAVEAAQTAASSWLSLVDQARYGESWDSAAGVFRKAIAKPAWEAAVRQARAPLAALGARKLTPAKDTDGKWRVSGYYVRPE